MHQHRRITAPIKAVAKKTSGSFRYMHMYEFAIDTFDIKKVTSPVIGKNHVRLWGRPIAPLVHLNMYRYKSERCYADINRYAVWMSIERFESNFVAIAPEKK